MDAKTTTTVTTYVTITTTVEKDGETSTTTTTQNSRKTTVNVSEEDSMDVVETAGKREEQPLKESFFGKEYNYTIEDVRDLSGNFIGRVKFFRDFYTKVHGKCVSDVIDTDREDAKRLCIENEDCQHVVWNPNAKHVKKGRSWLVDKKITDLSEKKILLNRGRISNETFVKIQ